MYLSPLSALKFKVDPEELSNISRSTSLGNKDEYRFTSTYDS